MIPPFEIFYLLKRPWLRFWIQSFELSVGTILVSVFFGLVVGALINYLADVLPVSRRIHKPVCSDCQQPYSFKDYFLRYQCSNCGKRSSIRTLMVFLSSVIVCLLLQFYPFAGLGFWVTLPILLYFGVIFVIDVEHHRVLFETSLFGFVLFSVYGIAMRGIWKTVIGAGIGMLVMLMFYFLGMVFTKVIGKIRSKKINEVAFGFGDVCFGTILGLFVGWPGIIGVIIIALLAFGAFSFFFVIGLIATKRYGAFSNPLPFTPFLILGAIVIFYL